MPPSSHNFSPSTYWQLQPLPLLVAAVLTLRGSALVHRIRKGTNGARRLLYYTRAAVEPPLSVASPPVDLVAMVTLPWFKYNHDCFRLILGTPTATSKAFFFPSSRLCATRNRPARNPTAGHTYSRGYGLGAEFGQTPVITDHDLVSSEVALLMYYCGNAPHLVLLPHGKSRSSRRKCPSCFDIWSCGIAHLHCIM